MNDYKLIFDNIYQDKLWGENESRSGFASGRSFVYKNYVPFLVNFIRLNGVKSVGDLGCGDFNFGSLIYDRFPNISYLGYDCVSSVIEKNKEKYSKYDFMHLDIFHERQSIKKADLFIIKDVFQHWDDQSIIEFMEYFVASKKYKFILVTNAIDFEAKNGASDIKIGNFRPLSACFSPLKIFDPIVLFIWGEKGMGYIFNGKEVKHFEETSLFIKR